MRSASRLGHFSGVMGLIKTLLSVRANVGFRERKDDIVASVTSYLHSSVSPNKECLKKALFLYVCVTFALSFF